MNPKTEEQSILYELILKSGFPLTAKIETLELAGKAVYNIEDKTLMICLEKELTFDVLDAIAEQAPQRFVPGQQHHGERCRFPQNHFHRPKGKTG